MFPLRQLAAALANVQLTSAHGPLQGKREA